MSYGEYTYLCNHELNEDIDHQEKRAGVCMCVGEGTLWR